VTTLASRPLLEVTDLRVSFSTRHGEVQALNGVSLAVAAGEVMGIVGESGSGKSVTAYAALGLLDRAGRVTGGKIRFREHDILTLTRSELRTLRGAALAMIFQNPRAALNPIRAVGAQIADVLAAHADFTQRRAQARALELLEAVRIREPRQRLNAYPHELSGGMCQRVMIAMAMAAEPELLIADEPTTGLDVTTQKVVMDLLVELTRSRGMGLVLITHDLGLASQYCQRVAVMQKGLVIETAPPAALFSSPRHPYTQRLVAASPRPTSTIADLVAGTEEAIAATPAGPAIGAPLLQVKGLSKHYAGNIAAVDGISFDVRAGESVGLVGESGSGKSTVARLICRLIDATDGTIAFDGTDIGAMPARKFHAASQRKDIQIVFQDAGDSINPRFNAFDAIADPLRRLGTSSDASTLRAKVEDAATRCGLPLALLSRFPHQLSGGQRARVGIARAIAVSPRLLVLDEPTAALDVSVQAVVLNLLDRLRREHHMAYLFVSHDLNVVRMMCERTIVLQAGRIVETGPSEALFRAPAADYTRELIAAIPHFDPADDSACNETANDGVAVAAR
jgi:peptide/nickel transport system ATP-binding protein